MKGRDREWDELPAIVTEASDEERVLIASRVKARIVDGRWTGKAKSNKYPRIAVETAKSREAYANYRERKFDSPVRARPAFQVLVAHVLLIDAGFWPTVDKHHASHLCHNNECVDVTHLEWSTPGDNNSRNYCKNRGFCTCGLERKCIFNAH